MSYAPTCPRCHAQLNTQGIATGTPVICGRCGATSPPMPSGSPTQPALNPYAPPAAANPFAEGPAAGYFQPAYDPAQIRRIAKAKVQGPAIVLILTGVLMIVVAIGLVGLAVATVMEDTDPEAKVLAAVLCGCAVLCVPSSGVQILAGIRMRKLRSYSLAMTATVLTMIMGFLICLPAILASIWPLVVLLDSQVKTAFSLPPAADEA